MEQLIYFPTFEPPNDAWLKFALIYLEDFRPIIPESKRGLLSDNFRQILDETDLINPYPPRYEDGRDASMKAKEEVETTFIMPEARSGLWNRRSIVDRWRNPDNWKFKIYEEKFSDTWIWFCEEQRIGRRTDGGILVSEELAFLYMTYLAKEIAFRESAAIITDNTGFDDFTNFARATTPNLSRRNRFAKSIINLLIPQNLAHVSFDKLIKFRRDNRRLITSFNDELDNVQSKIGSGYTERAFIDSYNNTYSELSREVLLQGIGVAAIPFAAYVLIQNPLATTPEYIKEILGAMGILLGGGYALNSRLKDTETKRHCKKYLTNLQRLR